MFRKFVLVTGILDFPIGLGVAVPAILDPRPETFTSSVILGALLCFAGAALVWASQELESRAPIVVWQGLVRLTAVLALAWAVSTGLEPAARIGVIVFDGIIAAIYLVGCARLTGASPGALLLGRSVA